MSAYRWEECQEGTQINVQIEYFLYLRLFRVSKPGVRIKTVYNILFCALRKFFSETISTRNKLDCIK